VNYSLVVAGVTVKRNGGGAVNALFSLIREKNTTGLDIIKFFDPAKAGIEVTPGKGGVTVKKTHKDKPFAGILREGDLVTAIGDAKVPSPEEFRRHLRAALAEGTRTITLTVSRNGKSFAVPVGVRR
jgi:S1-C subfamily serine protease